MSVFKSTLGLVWLSSALTQGATVGGVVLDPSRQPLPTAQVRLLKWPEGSEVNKTSSDKRGAYSLEVPRGEYSIEACLKGFLCVTYHPITLNTLGVAAFDFVLPLGMVVGDTFREEFLISGTIQTMGRPANEHEVCFSRDEAGDPVCVTTDMTGKYNAGLPAGSYRIAVASPAGKVVWRNTLVLRQDMRKDIDLTER